MWTAATRMRKILIKIYLRDWKTHNSIVTEALTNCLSCCWKLFIHIGTWMSGKDSMTRHYPLRRNSAAIWQWIVSQTLTTNMLKVSGKIWLTKSKPISWPVCAEWSLLLAGIFEIFRIKCQILIISFHHTDLISMFK